MRKPHSGNAGYVCELKSRHPRLKGHIVIYDSNIAVGLGDHATHRWLVMHEPGAGGVPVGRSVRSLADARHVMKRLAAGIDAVDLGQIETVSDLRPSGKQVSISDAPIAPPFLPAEKLPTLPPPKTFRVNGVTIVTQHYLPAGRGLFSIWTGQRVTLAREAT